MTYAWQVHPRPRTGCAPASLPPTMIGETAWDILLALHSDDRCELALDKLSAMVSAPPGKLNGWLSTLEERRLIRGVANEVTREIRAALTENARTLLDRYFSATSDLQVGVCH